MVAVLRRRPRPSRRLLRSPPVALAAVAILFLVPTALGVTAPAGIGLPGAPAAGGSEEITEILAGLFVLLLAAHWWGSRRSSGRS